MMLQNKIIFEQNMPIPLLHQYLIHFQTIKKFKHHEKVFFIFSINDFLPNDLGTKSSVGGH